jgi:hypothetical protein
MYPVSLIQLYLHFQCNSLENDLETGNIFGIFAFDGRRRGDAVQFAFSICGAISSYQLQKQTAALESFFNGSLGHWEVKWLFPVFCFFVGCFPELRRDKITGYTA